MLKVAAGIILAASVALFVSTITISEYWRQGGWEIPSSVFFGTPIAALALALLAFLQVNHALTKDSNLRAAGAIGLVVVIAVALGSMVLLRHRYLGDYNPLLGRRAPDGTAVTQVSWSKVDGRYIETINDRFKIELTQPQYREVMRKHQAPFLSAFVAVATLAALMAVLNFALTRRRKAQGYQP
jgi:hypothetical protein